MSAELPQATTPVPTDSLEQLLIERIRKGAIERYRMNVAHPHIHRTADGRLLNDYMRRKHWRDGEHTAYLTGELFAAFGTRVIDSPSIPPAPR